MIFFLLVFVVWAVTDYSLWYTTLWLATDTHWWLLLLLGVSSSLLPRQIGSIILVVSVSNWLEWESEASWMESVGEWVVGGEIVGVALVAVSLVRRSWMLSLLLW